MAPPTRPSQGSQAWFPWGQWMHDSVAEPQSKINVRDYGAKGDGTTDDSAAFAAAVTAAKATLHTIPYLIQGDRGVLANIYVPAGDYLITDPGAFLGDEAMTVQSVGLNWRGAGKSVSTIIFKPATAAALASNDYWQGLTFQDIGFFSGTAGCTFLQSYTSHAAQSYTFQNCRWWNFKYVFDLQGTDNNSEYAFYSCDSSGLEAGGAFLYIGATNTSDQFLNYWFYGFKHWSTSAPLIDAARGGQFHIFGLDASNWGGALAAPGYLFNLRGGPHADGVQQFSATHVRVEGMSANAGLIHSEWDQGTVAFHSVDWSSQSASFTYGNIIDIDYQGADGAG